jgi:hypothetical protein
MLQQTLGMNYINYYNNIQNANLNCEYYSFPKLKEQYYYHKITNVLIVTVEIKNKLNNRTYFIIHYDIINKTKGWSYYIHCVGRRYQNPVSPALH